MIRLSLFLYSKFRNSELSAVLHLVVPNIDPHPFFGPCSVMPPPPPPPPPKWGWKKQMKKILFGFGFVWKKFCSPFHFMRKILHLFFFFFSILYPSIYKRLISTLDTPIFRREFHPSNGFFEYIQKKILVILVLGLLKHISK